MSDAIEYCHECTTNVMCHLQRECQLAVSSLAASPCCASWDLIIRVLHEILPEDWMPDNPTRDTLLREDIGLDSLDLVEGFMVLEEELQRDLPDDARDNWKTLGDVLDYLHNDSALAPAGGKPTTKLTNE